MKLAIISHTEHYINPDGTVLGLGATVTEINHLLHVFGEIYHVAMLHSGPAPTNMLAYTSDRIKFIPIPAVGGHGLWDKFFMLSQIPGIIFTIRKVLKQCDYFQFRAPTGIGVFVIPYLIAFSSKKGWFKYAGNWGQVRPLSYRFQRWLLRNQDRKVTINGVWEQQPKHCLTFENPCLTLKEIEEGHDIVKNKQLGDDAVNLCFVGRLEEEKGIGIIIEALHNLSSTIKNKIGAIHIVGGGSLASQYKEKSNKINLNMIYHGLLSRMDVHQIYKQCHYIILPSASEGFPKVITEALNYGCIPIVSNISAIGYYIKHNVNGFLLDGLGVASLEKALEDLLSRPNGDYINLVQNDRELLEKFSYDYYNRRLTENVL
ncbi:glycosyltransferase [Aestuariivivens sediminis]|uniref:glycosyltransferase n=1 Tax=Aestuariivivens sediminis TaxID=2913557 RepID=UPI001F599D66|nr:glycosyltransferase [Aestuariivivens sediminis]